MKTTKSIVVILFALLTAQIASAYYCPSTGRWLSRDPMGETGFETLRAASVVPRVGQVISPASLPPSRWINRDSVAAKKEPNRYGFVANNPIGLFDLFGLKTLSVENCKIIIFYGHGIESQPYQFDFAGQCSAATFMGCWNANTESGIKRPHNIPGVPTTSEEMPASELDNYVTKAWAAAKTKAKGMCKIGCGCVCPSITITAIMVKTGEPILDMWVPDEHHYHPDESIKCASK